MLSCCSDCDVSAWIEIGTSWMFSVRRWAVTMTSAIASEPTSGALGRSAAPAPADAPASTQVTAYLSFEFMVQASPSLPQRCCRLRSCLAAQGGAPSSIIPYDLYP